MKKLLFLLLALTVSAPAFAQTQTQYYTVPTIAALKAMTTSRPAVVEVVDANPGIFNLSSGACSAADDIFQVQPTGGTTVCYTRMATPYAARNQAGLEIVSTGNFGNYSTLNAAVTAIGGTVAEIIVSKNQTLTASLTIPATLKLTFTNGGSITKASTYTLTINGQFSAPIRSQVFVGFDSGNVTFASGSVPTIYAEWWGAVADGVVTANEVPINKAFVASAPNINSVTAHCGTYLTAGPVRLKSNFAKWQGCGQDGATAISSTSTTAHCVHIGPDSYTSGSSGTFTFDAYVYDITCSRSATPISPPAGVISSGPAGFYIAGTIRTQLYRTQAYQDVMGYYEIDTINTIFSKTNANRAATNNVVSTFANGSPIITATNTFGSGQKVIFSTAGTLPTNFTAGTIYYVSATGLSGSAFQVSATSGGGVITAGSAGSGAHTVSGDAFVGWYVDGVGPTPTRSATATFTNGVATVGWTAHGMIANQEVNFTTTGGLPTNFTTGIFYFVSATNLTANTFEVSATMGGASIVAGSAGSGTQTAYTATCFSACFSLNASTYFDLPTVSALTTLPTSIGWYFPGSFSDQYMLWPGSANLRDGIVVMGPSALGLANTRTVIDLMIVQPAIDGIQTGGSAIRIEGINPYGAVSVTGGYGAFGNATSGSMVKIENARGVTIGDGFSFIGYVTTNSSVKCLEINSSAQIHVDGLWQDCYNPVTIGGTLSSGIHLTGSILNSSQASGLTGISVTNGQHNTFDVAIDSTIAGKFSNGVALDLTSNYNVVNAEKITTQVTNRVIYDGATIPTGDGYIGATSNKVMGLGSNAAQSFPTLTTTTGGTLQFGGSAATGIFTNGTNVALRGHGSNDVYVQSAVSSGLTFGRFSSNGLSVNDSDVITAGGSPGINFKTAQTGVYIGSGAPTVSGTMGSLYLRSDGTPSYNTNGSTGWNTLLVNGGALGTPSSGTVTNLTGTASININGTVGATTPAAGKFTTVNATTVASAYQIAGVTRMFDYATSYTGINDVAGTVTAAFNSNNIFFYAGTHTLQSSGGTTTFAVLDSTKLQVGTALPPVTGKISAVSAVTGCSGAFSDNVTSSLYICHIAGGGTLIGSDGTAGVTLGYGSTAGTRVVAADSTGFYPFANNTFSSGKTAVRWSNVYSVLGDFSSNVTVGGTFKVTQASPAAAAACTAGQIVGDANYLYACSASGAWKRVALTGGY